MPRLFANLTVDQADLCALILTTSAIPFTTVERGGRWEIWVKEDHVDTARNTIEAYFHENPEPRTSPLPPPADRFKTLSGYGAALLLLIFHLAIKYHNAQEPMIRTFGASADAIMAGELYRATTALMLHSNALHLMGNMAGIALFGTAVCAITRPGVGWLMILATGIIGNLANAALHGTHHLSIGASTAVFGAIGFLCAVQFWVKLTQSGERIKAWLPLAGGVALLGLLGSGGQSVDLMAHLLGLIAGLLLGSAHALFFRLPLSDKYQTGCWILSMGIILLAWVR